jgi:hypothetical protein
MTLSMTGFASFASLDNTPAVGMPATVCGWTDRHPFTVVRVSASGKTCWVRECSSRRTDNNGMSESQTWEITENPGGRVLCFKLCLGGKRRSGGWREAGSNGRGSRLVLGEHRRYFDFSF